MVAFDTNILLLLLDVNIKAIDPATGKVVSGAAERIKQLVRVLAADKETIIIPTPVLTELLVHADTDAQSYLDFFDEKEVFDIMPFDRAAAIEASITHIDALKRGGHRIDTSHPDTTRTKIKFDRQIVAIAKVEGAHAIYSEDKDVHKYAGQFDLQAYRTAELPLP